MLSAVTPLRLTALGSILTYSTIFIALYTILDRRPDVNLHPHFG